MAIPFTYETPSLAMDQVVVVKWNEITSSTAGVAWLGAEYADKTVHITGSFYGGSLTLQGSNEITPSDWQSLTDPQGNAIAKSSAGIEAVLENPLWIRPSVGTGDSGGTTKITCTIVAKRNRR